GEGGGRNPAHLIVVDDPRRHVPIAEASVVKGDAKKDEEGLVARPCAAVHSIPKEQQIARIERRLPVQNDPAVARRCGQTSGCRGRPTGFLWTTLRRETG